MISQLIEWNGYETRQTPLLCFCGPESAQRSKEFLSFSNRKQRIVHFHGTSNIKCSTVVFIIDICRFSQPVYSNNYDDMYSFIEIKVKEVCRLEVYSRWLRIFLSLKSPEEWAITKQACRDESVVFFLFLIFIYIIYINNNNNIYIIYILF